MTIFSLLILILVAIVVLSIFLLLFKIFAWFLPLIIVAAAVLWVILKLKKEGREDEKLEETPFWQQTHPDEQNKRKQAENFKVTFDQDDDDDDDSRKEH